MPGEKQVTVGRLDEPPSTTDPADGLAELGLDSTLLTLLRDSLGTARLWRYEAGDTLYHEGSDVEALYVIRRGRIKLLSYLPDGRARILRLHKRGGIIGLNGLLGEVHEHTAIAVDPLEVYRIPLGSVGPLKEHDPVAYSHLLEQWHSYLNYADTWITQFSTGPIRGRVARLLLFLADLDEDSGPGEVTLLSGEEMAEVLGVTPESVSRVLADFKRRRLLLAVGENDTERFRVDLNALSGEAGD